MDWSVLICGLLIVACFAIVFICSEKNAKEWLLWAVIEMETYLGSGTGPLKLRGAYDMFVAKFPVLATVVSFSTFSKWVDVALETMRDWLSNNKSIEAVVENGERED